MPKYSCDYTIHENVEAVHTCCREHDHHGIIIEVVLANAFHAIDRDLNGGDEEAGEGGYSARPTLLSSTTGESSIGRLGKLQELCHMPDNTYVLCRGLLLL